MLNLFKVLDVFLEVQVLGRRCISPGWEGLAAVLSSMGAGFSFTLEVEGFGGGGGGGCRRSS